VIGKGVAQVEADDVESMAGVGERIADQARSFVGDVLEERPRAVDDRAPGTR